MIRYYTKEDITEYQKLVTKVWQETYPGIVNQEFLNELSQTEQQRIELNTLFYNDRVKDKLLLEIDNKIVGFTHFGPTDDPLYPNTGEIFAIYILKDHQGKGYGKELIKESIKELLKQNYNNMIIGCISKNPSNEFYKHLGGIIKSQRPYPKTGDNLVENIYYFENINNML